MRVENASDLSDPAVRHGAQIEARYRADCDGIHGPLVDYLRIIAEQGQHRTSADLAAQTAGVFLAGRPLRERMAAARDVMGVGFHLRLRWRRLRVRLERRPS